MAYMIVDVDGYRWYFDSKEEMLACIQRGDIRLESDDWNYYELTGQPNKLSDLYV